MPTPKGTQPWNAGKGKGWSDPRGYRWISRTIDGKRRTIREHRWIIEQHLGRKLEPWEVVHHIDGNPSNNSIDNLELKEHAAHTLAHHNGQRHAYQSRKSMEAFGQMREEITRLRTTNADLLAALKDVLDTYQSDYEQDCKNLDPEDRTPLEETWERAEAAIAKAEGR